MQSGLNIGNKSQLFGALAQERRRLILRILQSEGSVRTQELCLKLSVSDMTIRRDFVELEKLGYLKRVHGGAVASMLDSLSHDSRAKLHLREKRLIAFRALDLIPSGGTIYLDSGSTAFELARALQELPADKRETIRVVTHASNIAASLAERRVIKSIYQIGGELDLLTLAATGPQAVNQISRLNFDLFFMGAGGIDPDAGWTNQDFAEVTIKHAVMKQARKTFVIAHSAKWGTVGFAPIVPLNSIQGWVTDGLREEELTRTLSKHKIRLIFAR